MTEVIGKVVGKNKEGDVETVKIDLFEIDGETEYVPQVPEFVPPEPEDWITVSSFQNGWSSFSTFLVQYRKRWDGEVELRGFADPGAQGVMFVLPEGYRPADTQESAYAWVCAGSDNNDIQIAVQATGEVIALKSSYTGINYVRMNTIRFYTD